MSSQRDPLYWGRVHTKLTEQKQENNTVFWALCCENSITFVKQICKLFVFSATLLSPSPVVEDQRFLFWCKFHCLQIGRSQRSADLSQVAEYMNIATRKCSTEETRKLMFLVYSMLASHALPPLPKKPLLRFFYIFDSRNIKPAAAMHMFSSSASFPFKRHIMYSLNCSCPLNADRTKQD